MDALTMFKISTVIMILGGIVIGIILELKKIKLMKSSYLYVLLLIAGQWVSVVTYTLMGSIWWAVLFFIIGVVFMMLVLKILEPALHALTKTLDKREETTPKFKIARYIIGIILIIFALIKFYEAFKLF